MFTVAAVDPIGNQDPNPPVRHFSVRLSPPQATSPIASATGTGATIMWSTDEACAAVVEYGLTSSYGGIATGQALKMVSKTAGAPCPTCGKSAGARQFQVSEIQADAITTSHIVVLSGLSPNTAYHYCAQSTDSCGRMTQSADATFTTGADTVPPTVTITSGPNEGSVICVNSAGLCWTGSDDVTPANQLVYSWALDAGQWSSFASDTCVDLDNLSQGGHTLGVKAMDAAGNVTVVPAYRHFSVALNPPAISGASVLPADSQATVTWTTDEPATSQVDYGPDTNYGITTPLNASLVTAHSVALSGLAPNSPYHCGVRSVDFCGRESVSGDVSFNTSADTTPPHTSIVSGPANGGIVCSDSVQFCWTGTDDVTPTAGLTYSWKMDSNAWSAYTANTCYTFAGLAGGNHAFVVAARDAAGNADPNPAYVSFRVSLSPTTLSAINAIPTDIQATITWATDLPSTSQVNYGGAASYGSTTPLGSSQVTSHQVSVTGLQPSTTYHFRVVSTDICGREVISADQQFTTVGETNGPTVGFTSGPANNGKACGGDVQFCWTGTDDVTPTNQLQFCYKMAATDQIDSAAWSSWLVRDLPGIRRPDARFLHDRSEIDERRRYRECDPGNEQLLRRTYLADDIQRSRHTARLFGHHHVEHQFTGKQPGRIWADQLLWLHIRFGHQSRRSARRDSERAQSTDHLLFQGAFE